MDHVFDTARGIASVCQRRTTDCTLCWFDSSDSCKDEPQAVCGRVERSKKCEISDHSATLGLFFLSLAKALQLDGRNQYLLICVPFLCCFLHCFLFRHLFPKRLFSCPDPTEGNEPKTPEGSIEGEERARIGACDSGQALVVEIGRALERDHSVQDNQVWRCRLGRVYDVASRITTDTL